MHLYAERLLPLLIDKACSLQQVGHLRGRVVPHASGTVLEVGMGSGLNLAYYNPERVNKVYGLEPSDGMRRRAAHRLAQSPVPVEWLDLPGEQVPLPDNSVDTVLLTFTLCTIPDWRSALAHMHRVLKPDGQLLFLEHGEAPDARTCQWQNRLNPIWKCVAGGCHLNRNIADLIRQGGFHIQELDTFYLPHAPKIAGFLYKGRATPTPELR